MHKARILIVDDVDVNILILEELLSDDYEFASARSGEEAQALAPQFEPHLVLLDVMMHGIDGYETYRWIRANPDLAGVKIIMVSAKASAAGVEQGLAAGADDYITKPFNHKSLLETVRKHLARSSLAVRAVT
jgi:CheY-like chemotaxis protein